MDEIFIEIPADAREAFEEAWSKASEGAPLEPPTEIERFDAGTIFEYGLQILEHVPGIIAAIAPFILARRGRVIVGEKTIQLEDYTAEEIERILRAHRGEG